MTFFPFDELVMLNSFSRSNSPVCASAIASTASISDLRVPPAASPRMRKDPVIGSMPTPRARTNESVTVSMS
ncbi:hypothetical protein D9602_01835 [Sphingomonas sp. TX0522]|nr:hypothetical protein [Sphingomonas sp. TX0522]